MANLFNDQTIMDSEKRVIIKLTATFDGSGQETSNTKVIGRLLKGALATDANANVWVTDAGAAARTNYNYTIKRIVYDVNLGGYLQMKWDGATPATIGIYHGVGDTNKDSGMVTIPNNAITPNGNITFTTLGAGANNSYAVTLELHKDGKDYDQGQRARPIDFNFGPYAVKP